MEEETRRKGDTSFFQEQYVEERLVVRKSIKHNWMTLKYKCPIQAFLFRYNLFETSTRSQTTDSDLYHKEQTTNNINHRSQPQKLSKIDTKSRNYA